MRNTYSKQMSEDLKVAYRDVNRRVDIRSQQEAFELTVREPAPRFYVSAEKARCYICPMLRGDSSRVDRLRPLRREMYHALFDVVLRLSRRREFSGRSAHYILSFAVNEPAPRFYIGEEMMRKVFRGWKRRVG